MKASKSKSKINRVSKNEKFAYWKYHIDSQTTSTLSRKAYCKINKLVYHRFCYWCRKLEVPSKSSKLIPVKIKTDNELSAVLCSIKLSNGAILNIHSLKAMAAVLGGLSHDSAL